MEVTSEEEFDRLLSTEGTYTHVLVDFHADWCGPCKRFAPTFEKLRQENPNVLFLKVNVDEQDALSARYEISAMPTFILFKIGNNKQVSSVRGANESAVRELLAST